MKIYHMDFWSLLNGVLACSRALRVLRAWRARVLGALTRLACFMK